MIARRTTGRTASGLTPVRTIPAGLAGCAVELGRLRGRLARAPHGRVGLLDAQIGSFVTDGIGGPAKLTSAPGGGIGFVVLAQESDVLTAPRAAAIGATTGGTTEIAARGRATETTILLCSHCELLF